MADTPDTILFSMRGKEAKAGLPPKNRLDSYNSRATIVGNLKKVSKIAFNPDGELFAVRGPELYRGPMPFDVKKDWFSTARRVGKTDWNKFKFLFFHPNGILYAVTKDGKFYKGPAPSNENLSWLYGEATMIGTRKWNTFDALFFNPEGILYGVTNDDRLVKRSPPTHPDDDWLSPSTTITKGGWRVLSHFMSFSPEGDLWCVDSRNGNIYKGPEPAIENGSYVYRSENLGWAYNEYKFLCFTIDKVIQSVVDFEFLPSSGKIISQSPEVLQSQIYRNKSGTPLKHTFAFSKTIKESSTFSHEHGFSISLGAELTFKAGVPFISETEAKISINTTTSHTWNFSETNETQVSFSSSTDVEVPAGSSIRMVASVMKGEMDVPYRATICTLFGYKTIITGIWKGVLHYNLMVVQEDYNG